jgi:hypothetical protein
LVFGGYSPTNGVRKRVGAGAVMLATLARMPIDN